VTTLDQTSNVLGALALVVTDQTASAVARASGQSLSAAAALSALHQFLDRPTLDQLRKVLGLTPSGAVRLVDRLAEAGLVTRGPGADRRSRAVLLTAEGRRAAERVAAARAATLTGMLADLSVSERQQLRELMGRVVAAVVRTKDGGAWTCRLCDLTACRRDAGECPAANAARERYTP
jgi:DNA-binding MarR family transcriptional regulator